MTNSTTLRSIAILVTAAIVLFLAGCVELVGQRMAMWYDAERDDLHLLLFYDGIHDSGSERHGVGREQIPQFVAGGDIMILDWPFHLEMQNFHNVIGNPDAEPIERHMARLIVEHITTRPVGHYRDAEGRIGGCQHIVIRHASRFLERLNATLNAALVEEGEMDFLDELPRTHDMLMQAAREGHQWIRLDGHALRFEFTVHPFEWRQARAMIMAAYVEMIRDSEQNERPWRIQILNAFAAAYDDTGGKVRVTFGDPGETSVFRAQIRERYEPSLEPVVIENVPLAMPGLWRSAPGRDAPPAQIVSMYRQFGPPEQVVMDTLNSVNGEDRTLEQALQLVAGYVRNQSDRCFPPPEIDDEVNPDKALEAWKTWSRRMAAYPMPLD